MNQQADTRRQGAELTAVLTILSVDGAEACRNGRRQHHQRQQQRRRGLLHPANHRRRAMRCTSAGAPSSILSGRGDDSCSSSSLSAVARLATKRRKRGCASQVATCTKCSLPSASPRERPSRAVIHQFEPAGHQPPLLLLLYLPWPPSARGFCGVRREQDIRMWPCCACAAGHRSNGDVRKFDTVGKAQLTLMLACFSFC